MSGHGAKNASEKFESTLPTSIPYFRLVFDQGVVTQHIASHSYPGSGTEDDPYAVIWIPDDPRNPMGFSPMKKWTFTMLAAIATLAVALVSSAYTGGIQEIEKEFGIGTEVATLGVSLFVVGFAVSSHPLVESSAWLV
jgi:L-rhamnose isomerase